MKRLVFFILLALFVLFAVACGSPRTAIRIRNNADGTQTTIDIKQGDGGALCHQPRSGTLTSVPAVLDFLMQVGK